MADALYPLLRSGAAAYIGSEPFLRLSRDPDALFASDLARRVPGGEAKRRLEGLRKGGWTVWERRGLCLIAPSPALLDSLRPSPPAPMAWSEAAAFAGLLLRYAGDAPADPAFALCLLRAVGLAGLGRADALRDVKTAYALALADKRSVRTPLTAALAYELAQVLSERETA